MDFDRKFFYQAQKSDIAGREAFQFVDEDGRTYARLSVAHSPKFPEHIEGVIEGSTPTSFKVLRGKTKIVGFKDRVEFDGEFVAHIEGRGFGEGIPYLIDNEGVEPFPFIDPQSNRHRVEFDAENGLEMTMRNGPSLSLACEVEINVTSGIIKSKPWLMPIVVCSFYSSAMLG